MMDTAYWISLHKILFFNARKYLALKKNCQSPAEIWQAGAKQLKCFGLTEHNIQKLLKERSGIDPGQELEKLLRMNIAVLFNDDSVYPDNLRYIYDPPAILYIKGSITPEDKNSMALVGARSASPYGAMVAEKLAGDLARAGITVVSGMARGIDTAAHKGALAQSGRTVAVLGCGVDVVYPAENRRLRDEIAARGAVISEFPMGTKPLPVNFPIRNRVISGLSLGTVVVEAAEKSGSLITADFALEQGREVFAVPGPVTSKQSKGPHKLIKEGARVVEDARDILEKLGFDNNIGGSADMQNKNYQLTLEENLIYRQLSGEPVHIDNIIGLCGLPSGKVSSTLTFMELKGLVRKLPGQYYTVNYN